MADEKDRSLEALERSFIEFSMKVSKSLESIGKELDSIHKRMADGEAASVRTSADLGAFKELVRDDLETLDNHVTDAFFTPSHYGPAGDGTSLKGNSPDSKQISGRIHVVCRPDSNVLVETEDESDSDSDTDTVMKIGVYYV